MAINTGLDNKRVGLNIIFSCIVFLTNAFISLFITPYITTKLGPEAYGFVKLANDFASYGSLFTLALNSMASRFIMLYSEKGEDEAARSYYSSITIANIIMALSLLIPTIVLILCINKVFNVPDNMITTVRWTFFWTLLNFLICLAGTTFGNCFFIKNRLDISSILTSVTSIIRAIFIIGLFALVGPHISIMAFGGIVVTAIYMPCNIYFHRKLTPKLYFDYKSFDWKKVWEVLCAGIWNSITKLSQILTTGLDLIVTNLLLGATDMGYLSIAKTIPTFISSLINTVGNSFTPNLMQIYVKGDLIQLKKAIKSSMKIMCIFATIPNAILIVLGAEFYSLWVPNQPAGLINILSILTAVDICIVGPMQPLYQIFILVNKIKESSIVFIIEGFLSIGITLICVKYIGFGVYAVAGVSVFIAIIGSLIYHLPMSAIYIGLPWNSFFSEIFKGLIILGIQCVIGYGINLFLPSGTWMQFLIKAIIIGIVGVVITVLGILDKEEKQALKQRIIKRINKRG